MISPVLNVAAFLRDTDMVGPGRRDALWVQGCTIRCPGCANQAYLEHRPRRSLTVDRLARHLSSRRASIDGLSVLGGEPTEQPEALVALLRAVRGLGLTTVVFTGRTLEALQGDAQLAGILDWTDLLVDGPFVQALAVPGLRWRGSSNQRLHLLRPCWPPEMLSPVGPTGELVVGSTGVLLHGVGTMALRDV